MTFDVTRPATVFALLTALTSCSAERPEDRSGAPGTAAPGTAAAVAHPDPATGGPVRPAEPAVAGPDNLDALTTTVRPDGGTPGGVVVGFDRTSRTADGGKPAAPRRFVFLFDRTIRFDPDSFPVCERGVLESQGIEACPEGSRVGSGRADNFPTGSAEVAVLNTRYPDGSRGVLITVPAARGIFENTLEPVTEPYRTDYAFASDEIVAPTSVPPAQRGASTRFQVSFGATRVVDGTPRSFVRSDAAAGSELRFGLWSEFVTGQVVRPEARVPRP